MHFNGQTFSGAFEQFSLTSKFLGLKMQKSTLKNGFESSFIKLTFRWLQTGLSQTIEILLMVEFLRIFKNVAFFHFFFEIFEIHQ